MLDLLVPYLAAMAITLAMVVAAIVAYAYAAQSAGRYNDLAERLPDAVRLPGLRAELEATERELGILRPRLTDAQAVIAGREAAEQWMAIHQQAYEEAQRELPGLTAAAGVAQRELATLQPRLADAQVVVAERERAEQWLAAHGAIYEEARRELPSARAGIEQLRRDLEDLGQERDEIRAEVSEGRLQREWVRQEDRRLSGLVDEGKAELERLTATIESSRVREAGLIANLEELEVKLQSRRDDLGRADAELLSAKKELHELNQLVAGVRAEHERMKREIEQFRIEHQNLTKLLDAAEKRWTQLAPAAGGAEEHRLAELWAPVLKRVPTKDDGQAAEVERLAGVQTHLKHLGLHFPDRVLRAFHTSLKVADVSPLVVLAGISGTGKSELPRRYAEAMGIHFLNIPVQPRWDSPQDMFGFYNYMENRYRATELARALVQMDPFFREPGRGWPAPPGWEQNSLADQMLLVLLDEMNLARVEYYFSEFLSRLETRRGIDRGDPVSRRKAEVALEVGLQSLAKGNGAATKAHQPAMQLFVDRNVMFVGTMNEDETTQTLSDKVIDRANVLRFGKPSRFDKPERNGHPVGGRPPLPFKQWNQWVRNDNDLPGPVSEAVNGWIHELNEAMQLIRRPFAHRTYAGMRFYVANYPEPDAFKDAMADQIELKILPKFRGLDPQDNATRQAVQKVLEVLEQVEDQQLLAAVEACLRQGEHQFAWHGVDRMVEATA